MTLQRHIIWNMTRKCNFRCHYCYFPHDNTPVTDTLPVEKLLEFLKRMGGEWLIGLTGGEPFLYPDIIAICQKLTRSHRIGLDTNLSVSSKVHEFAQTILPDRVNDIYASLHIEERERVKGTDAFIANYHALHSRGFNIIVNYVVHPTLAHRFVADRDYFASNGVTITPRPFKGRFEGRRYPEAYSPEIKKIFADHPDAGRKMVFNFRGVPCHGGHTFFRMEPDGTVFRCPGDKTVVGNVHDGIHATDGPTPCRMHRCPCQGVHYVEMTKAQAAFVEAMGHYNTGDTAAAQKLFERALSCDKSMSSALNNLGVIAMQDGRAADAAALFHSARTVHKADLYAANEARALLALGKTHAAEVICRQLMIDPSPSSPQDAPALPEPQSVCHMVQGDNAPPEMSDVVFPRVALNTDES